MQDTYIDEGVLIAVVIGITQIAKPFISERYFAIVPLAIGIIGGLAISGLNPIAAIKGAIIGLTAAGLYDQKRIAK